MHSCHWHFNQSSTQSCTVDIFTLSLSTCSRANCFCDEYYKHRSTSSGHESTINDLCPLRIVSYILHNNNKIRFYFIIIFGGINEVLRFMHSIIRFYVSVILVSLVSSYEYPFPIDVLENFMDRYIARGKKNKK